MFSKSKGKLAPKRSTEPKSLAQLNLIYTLVTISPVIGLITVRLTLHPSCSGDPLKTLNISSLVTLCSSPWFDSAVLDNQLKRDPDSLTISLPNLTSNALKSFATTSRP